MTRHDQGCPHEEEAVLLALHALDPEQEAAVARHVHTCLLCRSTIRDVEETFAEVAEATAMAPPPALRQRVMAAVDEQAPPLALRAVPRRAPQRLRSTDPGAARRGPRRWIVAVAAALVVLGIAGGGVVVTQLEQQRNAATAHAATRDDLLATIAASPHAVLVDPARHPLAAVTLDSSRFYALDLEPAPSGLVWVLWGARGSTSTALATVPAGQSGEATTVPVGHLGDYEAYLLTQEPAGPLPTRRGDVLASGPAVAATGS